MTTNNAESLDGFNRQNRKYHRLRIDLARDLLLPKAIGGERWAALRLIGMCGEAIGGGAKLHPDVATWLQDIMAKLSDGSDIEEAAGIPKRARGEKKEIAARLARGRRYQLAYEFGVRFKHERTKKIAAQAEVAELFNVDEETVLSAWKEYKVIVQREIDLQLLSLGKVLRITSPP